MSPMPTSPAAAYRADLAGRESIGGRHDEFWLAAATELHLAATSPELRQVRLYDAIGVVIDAIGDEGIDAIGDREWQEDRSHVEALLVLAELLDRAGAIHLCAVVLDDLLLAEPKLTTLNRGRVLAMRARATWKLGRRDEAVERYEALAALGRRARKPELVARAENGLGSLAQLRGNYPDMRAHSERAAKIADEHRLTGVARVSHYGLMVTAARAGRHDEALVEGWKVLRLSEGDAMLEAEILQNMGQLMLEAGHPAPARAGFAAVMERQPPARILLPALGGLAIASARTRLEPTVEWCVREVWRAREAGALPRYELASALVESAAALAMLGRADESARYLAEGASIASAEKFHELALAAEELVQRPAPAELRLKKRAARVADGLAALEPEQLPERLAFTAAPA